MGFLKPKVPAAPKAPNPAQDPLDVTGGQADVSALDYSQSSLITTGAQGLKKRPATVRASLIGGG